jgi:hypothetical protein
VGVDSIFPIHTFRLTYLITPFEEPLRAILALILSCKLSLLVVCRVGPPEPEPLISFPLRELLPAKAHTLLASHSTVLETSKTTSRFIAS